MDWDEFRAARLALGEIRVGKALRADAYQEDAAFEAASKMLRKGGIG